jgi:DNA polymerase bacteriophage-type
VLAWLAGEEWKLQAFRDYDAGIGPDLYLVTAGKIYHRPASDFTKKSPEREVGKRCELAFGYQGGVGAWRKFETYATKEYIPFSDEKVQEIKSAWRSAHPMIEKLWYELESAAYDAVSHPGTTVFIRPTQAIKFVVRGSFLFCRLPSGRVLTYPYPKLKAIETPWGEMKEQVHYLHVDGLTNQWEETHTYGGKLAENITQAVARDVLAEALVRLEHHLWSVVLHVHDEIVVEAPTDVNYLDAVGIIMARVPIWAEGLPIAVEGWVGRRYRK